MEDLSNKYKDKFDKLYCDNPNLSYVRYNSDTKKVEFMCKKHGLQSKEQYHLFNDRKGCKECISNNIKLLYYANYEYDFPYEVITDKNDLLLKIKEKNG